jgi:predicted Zn finger-like uncharacterized protein
MKIPFACPSCGAAGTVDASFIGRNGRCKHCGHRFTIPDPSETEPQGYAIAEPPKQRAAAAEMTMPEDSAFVSSQGIEPTRAVPRKPKRKASGSTRRDRTARETGPGIAWRLWLVRLAVAAVLVLAAIAMVVPRGTLIVACVLMVVGSTMVLVGYFAGAYGAFSEDFLYGFLYLVIPLYTAYYLVTRWEDLWVWFTCSTTGVALVLVGAQMARWAGLGS